MDGLQIGDEIWSGERYEAIVTFSHRNAKAWARFEEFTLRNGERQRRLSVSAGHYVLANGRLVPARDVQVGDVMSGFVVVARKEVVSKGLYNPHTGSGMMMVEEVAVSCYTENVPVMLGHAVLGVVRWTDGFAGAMRGVGSVVGWAVDMWHKAHGEIYE